MTKIMLLALCALLLLSCSSKKTSVSPEPLGPAFVPASPLDTTLSFVTFNMAVGFDAERMLTQDLSKPRTVLTEGRTLDSQFLASLPAERVRALADSINTSRPDVVGLQEVLYLINRQNSQSVDFLALLLHALDSLGAPVYGVVRQVMNPLPVKVTVDDAQGRDSIDIYFQEGNAILYKQATLTLAAADSTVYFVGIRNLPYLSGTFEILRGAVYARFRTARNTFLNVFNTHLEVESLALVGFPQVSFLMDYIRAKQLSAEAVVLMGDMNDPPDGGRIAAILNGNFTDTYTGPARTCCYEIPDPAILPTRRIDYIFTRGIVAAPSSGVGLNGTFRPYSADFRLSDHAGVAAQVTFH
ncbi:MAG: endonuclease/exonuclease/phosphatase family protein [Fibrobacterota bacterium]